MYNYNNYDHDNNYVLINICLTIKSSVTVSANPTTYKATATALAKEKIIPMAPPKERKSTFITDMGSITIECNILLLLLL